MLYDELIRGHVVGEATVASKDVVSKNIATLLLVHRCDVMLDMVKLRGKWIKLVFIVAEKICRWPSLHPLNFLCRLLR